jgi:hypothetical protein
MDIGKLVGNKMSRDLTKEEIEDIEYLQKNLFKSLKIPLNLHGLKEDDGVGTKSLEIINQNKDDNRTI